MLSILLTILGILFCYFFYHYKKIHRRFDKAGIKYLPGVPIFGNTMKTTFLRKHFVEDLEDVYKAFPEERYVGFIDGMIPVILVRDPELMKTITVRDFDHFVNRKDFFPTRLDPLLGRDLLQLKDDEWRATRNQMTSAFTAARLRYMTPILANVAKNIVDLLKSLPSKDVELTEAMYRYSGDSILAAAFGIDRQNAGKKESLYTTFADLFYMNTCRRVLVFMSLQFPRLGEAFHKITGVHLFTKSGDDFLRDFVAKVLQYRAKNNISVPDYMDVLLKMAPEKSIDDIAGQFFLSYAASLESTSGTLRLCFHELCINQDIQQRLYEEIRSQADTGDLTMESLNELKYLDCVFNETSRRWSASLNMDRVCSKTYILPPPREGGKPYTVHRGDMIYNVVNPVQMDSKYHPNPEIFDPDRFLPENKSKIQPFTFLPFGVGPRGCLGARFAILQTKAMIYYMILNFKLVKCRQTTDPIRLQPDEFNIKADGGTWVRLEPRTEE